jgi:hypothetical protein
MYHGWPIHAERAPHSACPAVRSRRQSLAPVWPHRRIQDFFPPPLPARDRERRSRSCLLARTLSGSRQPRLAARRRQAPTTEKAHSNRTARVRTFAPGIGETAPPVRPRARAKRYRCPVCGHLPCRLNSTERGHSRVITVPWLYAFDYFNTLRPATAGDSARHGRIAYRRASQARKDTGSTQFTSGVVGAGSSGISPARLCRQRPAAIAARRIRPGLFLEIHHLDIAEYSDLHSNCPEDRRRLGRAHAEHRSAHLVQMVFHPANAGGLGTAIAIGQTPAPLQV